jgi:hypothetical protein
LKVKKRSLLIIVVMLSVFLIGIGSANAVWKIGGTGPFLNYPFYIDGAADGVTFKTYAVLNNTDAAAGVDVVAAIHYVTSNGDGDATAGLFGDLHFDDVQSEFDLRDTHLTATESRILIPGITNPGLGPEVTVWADSRFKTGWMELWSYRAGHYLGAPGTAVLPHPPTCSGKLRGEAVTVDLSHSSAWTYKAVASVPDPQGLTSDMWTVIGAPTNAPVACSVEAPLLTPPVANWGANPNWDVYWKTNPSWHSTFILPTGYNRLGSAYNLDLWVKSPGGTNPNNNTIVILTNPNNRKLAGSTNTCRDCTHVSMDIYNSLEESDHSEFELCEMRTISILDDFSSTIAHDNSFYGWGVINEVDNNVNDEQNGNGCALTPYPQWLFPIAGPTNPVFPIVSTQFCCHVGTGGTTGIPCLPDGPQTICGLVNPADLSQGCNACDISITPLATPAPPSTLFGANHSQGLLAVAYTSWEGVGISGLTYWGNNLFNNCGDATPWNLYGGPGVTTINNCP